MPAVFVGTPVQVIWAAGASPGAQNITIPSDATGAYMKWAFDGIDANGHGVSSVTLNGEAPTRSAELPTEAGFYTATGVSFWYAPATGSRSLQVAWTIAPVEGPVCTVFFTKDGQSDGWRDADMAHALSSTAVSVTVATEAGDLVAKFDQRYDTSENPPSLSAGWTNGLTGGNVDEGFRLSYISASGTTQVCACEDEEYSSITAISIGPVAAGVTRTPTAGALALTGSAPAVGQTYSVAPTAGALALAGIAPTVSGSGGVTVAPSAGALVATALTAAVTRQDRVTPSAAAAVLAGVEPSLTYTLPAPPAGSITAAGQAPGVIEGAGRVGAAGAATLQGAAPVLVRADSISPQAAALSVTGQAPSVSAGDSASAEPAAGVLSLAGLSPAVTRADTIAGGVGALALQGNAPSISANGNTGIAAAAGAAVLQGSSPTISQTEHISAQPNTAAAVLATSAPIVVRHDTLSPAAAAAVLQAFAPTVGVTSGIVVSPSAGAVSVSGQAPSIEHLDQLSITPAAGALQLAGLLAGVASSGSTAPGALRLTGSRRNRNIATIKRA